MGSFHLPTSAREIHMAEGTGALAASSPQISLLLYSQDSGLSLGSLRVLKSDSDSNSPYVVGQQPRL